MRRNRAAVLRRPDPAAAALHDLLPTLASHSPETADLLTGLWAGGQLGEVDQARLLTALRQVSSDPRLATELAMEITKFGPAAAGHTSGQRDVAGRIGVHDVIGGRVRLGRIRAHRGNVAPPGVDHVALDLDMLRTSMLVVAPPGAGKTRSIALPIVEQLVLQSLANRASVVVVDPKGDDFDYPDWFDVTIDPLAPTIGFSLFGGADTAEEAADRLASALLPASVSDDKVYFADSARNALYGCLAPFRHARGRWPTVTELLRLLRADQALIDQVKSDLKGPGSKELKALLDTRRTQAGGRMDPAASVVERFALLDRPALTRLFDHPAGQFCMQDINRPIRVRVVLPEAQLPDASRILARLVVSQFVQVVTAPTTNRGIFKGLVFDEAGRFVDDYVAQGVQKVRSNNAGMVLLTQSLGDFPRELVRTIFGSIGCKVVAGRIDPQDAEVFSAAFGDLTEYQPSMTVSRGAYSRPGAWGGQPEDVGHSRTRSVNVRPVERPRFTPAELAADLPHGCAVVTLARADGRTIGPMLVDLRA